MEDESIGWQPPTTRMIGNDGKWEFTDGIPPTFDRGEHWGEDSDDDDVTDLTDEATAVVTAAAESDAATEKKVRIATGDAEYNANWNGIESSNDPTLATLRLLHSARQIVDTSRWWTRRSPNSAISLLGTACGLSTEGTFKLLRALRKVGPSRTRTLGGGDGPTPYGGQRGETSVAQGRVAGTLTRSGEHEEPQGQTDAGMGHAPAEADLHDQVIKSQLGRWRKLRRMQVAAGGQRGIMSYFTHAPHTRAARSAQAPVDGSAAAATAATSPAATAARLTATAATASQLRRLASELTAEQPWPLVT